eukprot:scaffold204839_cov16-Tisochrysis_lutea.AAC.1
MELSRSVQGSPFVCEDVSRQVHTCTRLLLTYCVNVFGGVPEMVHPTALTWQLALTKDRVPCARDWVPISSLSCFASLQITPSHFAIRFVYAVGMLPIGMCLVASLSRRSRSGPWLWEQATMRGTIQGQEMPLGHLPGIQVGDEEENDGSENCGGDDGDIDEEEDDDDDDDDDDDGYDNDGYES